MFHTAKVKEAALASPAPEPRRPAALPSNGRLGQFATGQPQPPASRGAALTRSPPAATIIEQLVGQTAGDLPSHGGCAAD